MIRQKLTAAALGVLIVASVFVVRPARAADTPDSWITMKTQIALMTTEGVHTSDLNVDTVNGVVTLHGKVGLEAEKAKAEQVARGIDGVKQVKNLLQVVPGGARRDNVDAADTKIKDDIQSAFKANRRIADSGISVASVNKGVVLLSGKTKSIEAHLEAVQVANAVRGVKHVSTEVQVEPARP
jgi:hyperosmotically inducible protein